MTLWCASWRPRATDSSSIRQRRVVLRLVSSSPPDQVHEIVAEYQATERALASR